MIIGISGYINGGKDTAGKIIRDLFGHYEAREDMGAGYRWIWDKEWDIKKFATKLKQIASMLTGIPVEKFEDQEFKKTYLGPEWSLYWTVREEPRMTVREFLQRLGTEAMRDGLHHNVWVNALFSDYTGLEGHIGTTPENLRRINTYPNWIITDPRFPNEAKAIVDRGGLIFRVHRGPAPTEKERRKMHPSETSLDDWPFDEVIDNNGTIKELTQTVKRILIKRKIIETVNI